MKQVGTLLIFILVCKLGVFAQFDCAVKVEALQGQYYGDCKKGLAHGDGAAKGIDTYKGKFKKGFPHGFGVYTYANGSNYIGNYRQGLKDGYGLMNTITDAGDLVQDYGLWLADSLIAGNDPKALFKVNNRKGVKLIAPRLTRDDAIKSQVWINFQVNGVTDKTAVISKAEITSGKELDTKKRALNTLVAFDEIEHFPVTIYLEYEIRQTNHFEPLECHVELTLFTKGRWEIDLNH